MRNIRKLSVGKFNCVFCDKVTPQKWDSYTNTCNDKPIDAWLWADSCLNCIYSVDLHISYTCCVYMFVHVLLESVINNLNSNKIQGIGWLHGYISRYTHTIVLFLQSFDMGGLEKILRIISLQMTSSLIRMLYQGVFKQLEKKRVEN